MLARHTSDLSFNMVNGTRTAAGTIALLNDALRSAGVITGILGDTPLVAVFHPALDTAYVYRNPEDGDVIADGETVRVDGEPRPPGELPLPRSSAFDATRFARANFFTDTGLVTGP